MSTPGVSIIHDRTDVPEDSEDADLIQPSDWLDEHRVVGAIGMVPNDLISVPALLDDRALVATAHEDPLVFFAGAAARITAPLPGEGYYVRVWHEDDQTLLKVSPDEGVSAQRMVVHRAAVWASLVVVGEGGEFNYQPWAADTGMPSDRAVSGDGSFWVVSTPGTSGSTEPDWSSHIGGVITDGTVEWQQEGDVPDSGAFRAYSLYWEEPD